MAGKLFGLHGLVGQVDEVHTSQLNPLMSRARDEAGNEFIYLKGVSSLVAYDAVTFDENGATALLAADAVGPVAFAQAAVNASTSYGWFMIFGLSTCNMVANSADNARLGRETTDGKVGDGFASGDQILGATARSATTTASTGLVQLNYPYVANSA